MNMTSLAITAIAREEWKRCEKPVRMTGKMAVPLKISTFYVAIVLQQIKKSYVSFESVGL